MLTYLSPTSLMTWEKNQEDFYLKYLAKTRPPREPQTRPMSIGSSFDAYVKNYFFERLFGKGLNKNFDLKTIFNNQVEEHNREWAWDNGKYVFDCYVGSGACNDLYSQLEAGTEPRFEFTVSRTLEGVPLLGKPDVYFIHKEGTPIILDHKVNGYCGNYNTSPVKGYMNCRDSSGNGKGIHKICQPMKINGIKINISHFLEDLNIQWATQLATYAWLCGAPVGSSFVVALDQIVAKPGPGRPILRVAEHRSTISEGFQVKLLDRYKKLWDIINSNYIFRDMTEEDSHKRCEMLDLQYKAYNDPFMRELR